MLPLVLSPSRWIGSPSRHAITEKHLTVATRDVVTPMATLSPTMRLIKPCLPTLGHLARWTEARGTLCSPSLDLHRLSKLIGRSEELESGITPSKEDGQAFQWSEKDVFIDNENIADDAESTTSASTSSPPPSPLSDLPPSTSISSDAIYSTPQLPVSAADLPVARVLFAGIAEDPPATNTNEDDRFRYSVTRSALREHMSYSELYPGEEEADNAYFNELPVFADSPPPSTSCLLEPIALVTPKKSTYSPDSHSHASRDLTSALKDALPPPTPSFAPTIILHSIPTDFSIRDYELVETILETIDEEDEEWESSSDALDPDKAFDPCSAFLSPAVKPPSHLVQLPSDKAQHYPPADKWIHLPSLRAPLSRREMRGCNDWRDGLRREAIGRSATVQQLPWWR